MGEKPAPLGEIPGWSSIHNLGQLTQESEAWGLVCEYVTEQTGVGCVNDILLPKGPPFLQGPPPTYWVHLAHRQGEMSLNGRDW